MADVFFIGLALVLFVSSAAYVRGCSRLMAEPARSDTEGMDDR